MFRDYSFRAVQVLMLARRKAGERGASALEVEDLLAGLIIEDQGGLAKEIFGHRKPPGDTAEVGPRPQPSFLPPDLASGLLASVQALCTHSQPVPNDSDLLVSDSVQRIFTRAAKLRDDLEQTYVEPLHLLAATLEDASSRGAHIFSEAGITPEQILKFIQEEPEPEAAKSGERPATSVGFTVGPPVYSQRTREALFLARQEARIRGAEVMEVEDVLVALVIEDQENFLDALSRYPGVGVALPHVEAPPHRHFLSRGLAADLLKGLEPLRTRSQALSPAADQSMSAGMKQVFANAARLRDELQHSEIEPLHLLGAILGDESNRGAQTFREAGITREKVIQFLREGT